MSKGTAVPQVPKVPEIRPCQHYWMASQFIATNANSAFMTGWKTTHIKCTICAEERAL